MHINKLKYFIDLVECLSFTEVAKRNYVSQTSVSQAILALEELLDLKLVDRSTVPISITALGLEFYEDAKLLVYNHNMTLEKYKNRKDVVEVIKIAYTTITDIMALAPNIEAMRDLKSLQFEIHKVSPKNIAELLQRGVFDCALASNAEFKQTDGFEMVELARHQFQICIRNQHPLNKQKTISADDVFQYPLIMLSASVIGDSFAMMKETTQSHGLIPHIAMLVEDIETEIFHIMMHDLIGFFPKDYPLGNLESSITLRDVENFPHDYQTLFVFSKGSPKTSLNRVRDIF